LTPKRSPDLTWRDIQHLCVQSAILVSPEDPDWDTTAVGRQYSYKYGYGRLDAYRYVEMARNWKVVKPQAWIFMAPVEIAGAEMINGAMKGGESITKAGVKSTMKVTAAQMVGNNFQNLEHITVKVWIKHTRRGDVEVSLVSPKGIKSVLAGPRKFDEDTKGFVGWQFMTLKHW
jgi:kexin